MTLLILWEVYLLIFKVIGMILLAVQLGGGVSVMVSVMVSDDVKVSVIPYSRKCLLNVKTL